MRFSPVILVLPLLSACFRADPLRPEMVPEIVAKAKVVEVPKPLVSAPTSPPRFTSQVISGITFEGVAFDSRTYRLIVADQANGPGTQFADAGAAARASGGIAAINAGFFTPEGTPLGLVVSSGKTSGSWNTASSLGSGAWHENETGMTAVTRREKLGRSAAGGMWQLIQAGPLLVENSQPISGLDATKTSVRVMILWDGGTRWWIGRGSPCSLSSLGQALATHQPAGWKTHHALNLDGGRSADLWVSGAVPGGPVVRRPAWNRPVRNFLVLR
ncbi:MAG: phosphodiester glycosidase family protein, partial [Akkermansiaceae bacterium]